MHNALSVLPNPRDKQSEKVFSRLLTLAAEMNHGTLLKKDIDKLDLLNGQLQHAYREEQKELPSKDAVLDWSKISTWESELVRVQKQIAKVTGQLVISDGSLRLDYQQTYALLRMREKVVKSEILKRRLEND